MQSFDTPILVLIFNREHKTRRLLELLKKIRPKKLFISADGPRAHKVGEAEKCKKTRAIFNEIDWDCEVFQLYREKNLGCKRAVHGGISWFFEQVEQGIILEDDCIPDNSFFQFSQELLDKYAEDESISHISAHNPVEPLDIESSYTFTNQVLVWGWASWRRAWKLMDIEMQQLDNYINENKIDTYLKYKPAQEYIIQKWQDVNHGKLDSWAYPWAFSCIASGGLAIIPKTNLINNIGFDEEATNTNHHKPTIVNHPIPFPLTHPNNKNVDKKLDLDIFFQSQKSKRGLILRSSMLYKLYQKITSNK